MDGDTNTRWQSPPISRGIRFNRVTLEIDLQQVLWNWHARVLFNSHISRHELIFHNVILHITQQLALSSGLCCRDYG